MPLIVELQLKIERPRARAVGRGGGRIIGERRIMHREVDRIEPEPVHTAIEPEPCGIEQFLLHRRMVAVELRLFLQEIVEVILLAARIPRPCGATEDGLPVGRRTAVGLGVGPYVPVGLVVRAAGTARLEPRVFVRGVRIDLVDDDPQPERMRARDQDIEIVQRPEDGIDVAVIRHVIPEILHRGREEGRQPHRIDPERRDIVEMRGDARQIADPVAVRISEAARIDLVDRRALPPGSGMADAGWTAGAFIGLMCSEGSRERRAVPRDKVW